MIKDFKIWRVRKINHVLLKKLILYILIEADRRYQTPTLQCFWHLDRDLFINLFTKYILFKRKYYFLQILLSF
jgi:hypothetical protein